MKINVSMFKNLNNVTRLEHSYYVKLQMFHSLSKYYSFTNYNITNEKASRLSILNTATVFWFERIYYMQVNI